MDIFYPHCTTPPDEPGIVAVADVRGTLSIVWSCLAVIILCTWIVLHENVPVEGLANGFLEKCFLALYLTSIKLSAFLFAFFAPELFTGKAMMCLYFACHGRKGMARFARKDDVEWSLVHALLANMGGFAIEFKPGLKAHKLSGDKVEKDLDRDEEKSPVVDNDKDTPAHETTTLVAPTPQKLESQAERCDNEALRKELRRSFKDPRHSQWFVFKIPKVARGRWQINSENQARVEEVIETATVRGLGKHSRSSYMQNLMALRGNIWVVDGVQLQYARDRGIIKRLPRISEEEIKDKSKGDILTKLSAVLQVTWLWVQLVLRKTQGLPATQLEIMTAAFATCSSITYGMYLCKPKDVSTRVRLEAHDYPTAEDMAELGRLGPTAVWFRRVYLAIGNDNYHQLENGDTAPALILTCGLVGMVFGSVHFACWNSVFPTGAERLGWRVSCGLLLGLPVPICSLMLVKHGLEKRHRKDGSKPALAKVLEVVVYMLDACYVLARLFIIVESGRSLWYLPTEAFTATWAYNVPHV